MKKILFYISLVIGIALLFLFSKGNNINILAYQPIDTTLGSYPIQLDIDNYDTNNVLNITDYENVSAGISYRIKNNHFIIAGIRTGDSYVRVHVNRLTLNGEYTLYRSTTWAGNLFIRDINNSTVCYLGWTQQSKTCQFDNKTIATLQLDMGGLDTNIGISINGYFMLYKGNQVPNDYIDPFVLGNMVSYKLNLYNPTSSSITSNVIIKNNDNILVNNSVTINSNSYYELKGMINSSTNYYADNRFYLPYNINENGNISFDYKLSIEFTNTNIVLLSDENISNDSNFTFEPIYKGYYKSESTNNIYFKNTYVFNSISYIGFNATGNDLNNIYFSCFGNEFDEICLQKSLFVASNTATNIVANNLFENRYSNYINFDNVFITSYDPSFTGSTTNIYYSYLFSFSLNIGNTSNSISSGATYYINMSYISLSIVNDNSLSNPLPDNPNTKDKYNSCSAWYDIPCQLGNAITYVIYEAPIISPIINFFDGLIEPVKQFIRLIDQFSGFGILFGLGITAMLICIIKKMYGGGDS